MTFDGRMGIHSFMGVRTSTECTCWCWAGEGRSNCMTQRQHQALFETAISCIVAEVRFNSIQFNFNSI